MAGKQHNGDDEFLHRLRHSAAHVMAEAVLQLYPDAKIAIGPAIDTGFYYDFDLGKDEQGRPKTFTPGRPGRDREAHAPVDRGQKAVPVSRGLSG